MLYAFGSNGSGQLGLGHKHDISEPEHVSLPEIFDAPPKRISAGGNHTLALGVSGKLYAAGRNEDGRCGLSQDETDPTHFRAINFANVDGFTVSHFDCCCAAWEASILAASDGRVYTCGTGSKGELGQGIGISESLLPRPIPDFPPEGTRTIDLAACLSHVVAVLSDGRVYGWGSSRKGQLGRVLNTCWSPIEIYNIPFKAVRALCGKDFTIVLGEPEEGQYAYFGSGNSAFKQSAPVTLPSWKEIGASWNGVYVLLASGKLLAWGRNDYGQLPPENVPELCQIAVGSEHVIVITVDGTVIAWGWGEHGNCGNPEASSISQGQEWNTIQLQHDNIFPRAVAAGCASSWIFAAPASKS